MKLNVQLLKWYKPSKLLPRFVMNATDYIPQQKKGLVVAYHLFQFKYEIVMLSWNKPRKQHIHHNYQLFYDFNAFGQETPAPVSPAFHQRHVIDIVTRQVPRVVELSLSYLLKKQFAGAMTWGVEMSQQLQDAVPPPK